MNANSGPKVIDSFEDISKEFDTLFLDMFGVLWSGTNFYPNVLETLKALKQSGKNIYILTNMSALKEAFISSKEKKGLMLGTHYDGVITSGDVLAFEIKKGVFDRITGKADYRYYVIGKCMDETLFQEIIDHKTTDITKADVVYLSTVQVEGNEETFDHLLPDLKKALALGLPAVCANPDQFFMREEKQLPTQGAMGVWYEQNGGRVHYFGKPYAIIFDYALTLTQSQKERTMMVGDMMDTDIIGGHNCGLKTVLVTGTGITANLLQSGQTLDLLYRQKAVRPDFVKARFAESLQRE